MCMGFNHATATLAATAVLPSEDMYLSDVPIVLTASRLSQPITEAPAAMTIIDREMIKQSGAWDLSELFRLVPGMFVSYHSTRGYATDSTVSYHGLMVETMSSRMQVLIDGRTVYLPQFGGVIWSDLAVTLDDIDRIEVTRGPNAVTYGANSFLGVINIITRHSSETQGTLLSMTSGRSRDEVVARYGGQNKDLTYRITASLRNDKGEDENLVRPPSSEYIWTKNKYDDKKIQILNFRGDYRASPVDEVEFQLGFNGGYRQEGEANDVIALNKRADNYFGLMRWRKALNDGGEFSLQMYHAIESTYATMLDTDKNRQPAYPEKGDVITRRDDLEIQHTLIPSNTTRLVWGGSIRRDTVYAPYALQTEETRLFRLARLFGNVEWRAKPDLIFNLGAMIEKNNYTNTDISPRAAVNWHFFPNHTLRLSNSRATRTPSIYDNRYQQYTQMYVNPNLVESKVERVNSTEVGYLGKFRSLNIDFRVFREKYSDLIADEMQAVANGSLNSGRAIVKGFETQLTWDVTAQTRLIYGWSHALVESDNADKVPYTNSVPTNNQNMMLTHHFDSHWSTSLMGYQVGEVHFRETGGGPQGSDLYFIPTHRRWDGRVAYQFKTGQVKGELALVVQNLSDANYFEFRFDNEPPGRSAWLNLKLEM